MSQSKELRIGAALEGRYTVIREIGRGGMATVFLAHDVKHDRDVALKVLHRELAAALGADRFLAEIRTTAQLHHPNILPLFDSGQADGLVFYVMPYVEGENLRDRITREGQLGVTDSVRIAQEVADALEHAHKHGVIHRDIKPENILLQDGHALVADFGIAIAITTAAGHRITQTGFSVGTPQYMSPEQAAAERQVDGKSDQYSLGAVLYEMLVGEPPFTGPNAPAIMSRMMSEPVPDVTRRRPSVPELVATAIHRALEKVPGDRFPSVAAFSDAMRTDSGSRFTGAFRVRTAGNRAAARWRNATALMFVALVATVVFTQRTRRPPAAPVLSVIVPPAGQQWHRSGTAIALSPDGMTLVSEATDSAADPGHLVLRRMDRLGTVRVAGTEGGTFPFWSPDGASLGFFAGGQLKRVDLATGTVSALCPALAPFGGTWGTNGKILFVAIRGQPPTLVNAAGGECRLLALAAPVSAALGRPYFLPDGEHYILASFKEAWLARLGDSTPTLLIKNQSVAPIFAPPDYLLVDDVEAGMLTAQRIDVAHRRMIGSPQRLLDRVDAPNGNTTLAASAAGDLVAAGPGFPHRRYLAFLARAGGAVDSFPMAEDAWMIRPSHDGTRVAVSGWGFWLFDMQRRVMTRAPVELDTGRFVLAYPTWAPHDTAISVTRQYRDYGFTLFDPRNRSARNWVFDSVNIDPAKTAYPQLIDWSADGRYVMTLVLGSQTVPRQHIIMYDVTKRTEVARLVERGDVSDARFSPDGHWIAYASNSDGRDQVYVRPFPGPGAVELVSPSGGNGPRWRADGKELFYVTPDHRIQAVSFAPGGAIGAPVQVINGPASMPIYGNDYEPMPDGRHFVLVLQDTDQPGLLLVQNWRALLK